MGEAFEKQIKEIEDQGQKQVEALENLKLKPIEEETKLTEDKPNNQSRAAIIFNDLIDKRKKIMKELHDSADYNNLNCQYGDPKNDDVSFYEYMDSKELF